MISRISFRSAILLVLGGVVAGSLLFFIFSEGPQLSEIANTARSVAQSPTLHRIQIGDAEIFAEYAQTDAERARGLSGHAPLGEREGMLFFFPAAGMHGFWMKDMLFDLDMVWIRGGRVIGVREYVPAPRFAGDSLPTYYPPEAADMVLEIGSGQARALGVAIGDPVVSLE